MRTELKGTTLTVYRDGEKFYTESAWWHALKKHLNKQGRDLVKKVMNKDGHMMGGDSYPYYLRDRNWKYCFYDGDYCLRDVHRPDVVSLIYTEWP